MKTTRRPETRPRRARGLGLGLIFFLGCAHAEGRSPAAGGAGEGPTLDSTLRFRNAAPVRALPPGPSIPLPEARPFYRQAYFFDAYLGQRTVRALSPQAAGRARNVNAFGEVPDDSWFENRIGVRQVTPQEIRQGPEPQPPFLVLGSKVGGVNPGMKVKDATGALYILKFDRPEDPESETATDVVVQRLLWAAGYHTAFDVIRTVRPETLALAPEATLKTARGEKRPMTAADLAGLLARTQPGVGRRPDGSYRVLLSRFLPGTPLGGFPQEGVRPDDPNDRIPHQDRREQRGARVFFAWLNHVDIKEDNFVDTWVEDPAHPGRGWVRHQLVDFGNSLGVFNSRSDNSPGFTHQYDGSDGLKSLVALGLWRRPWEGVSLSALRGVGNLESTHFDPARWTPRYPWAPFERFDAADGFWAASILMRFGPEHVAAAVAEGQYSDPRAAAYVTRTLIERQRKLGRYHLAQLSSLRGFTVMEDAGGARLCFEDALIAHFGTEEPDLARSTAHRARVWDFRGRPLPYERTLRGHTRGCLSQIPLGPDADGYTIVDVSTHRGSDDPRRVLVHLARGPEGTLRVIGVRRLLP